MVKCDERVGALAGFSTASRMQGTIVDGFCRLGASNLYNTSARFRAQSTRRIKAVKWTNTCVERSLVQPLSVPVSLFLLASLRGVVG
jgi:hypothetical protein